MLNLDYFLEKKSTIAQLSKGIRFACHLLIKCYHLKTPLYSHVGEVTRKPID